MKAPVTHINLLQRSGPTHPVGLALAAILFVTVVGTGYYGWQLRSQTQSAIGQRDAVTQQLKAVQAGIAAMNGAQARSAEAIALRKELDVLQPQADLAKALVDAVQKADRGRTEEFSRALSAMAGVSEPGLWLTALNIGAGGKGLELQGEANNGAAVLRYARRANQTLQPLAMHLDSLELQPATGSAAAAGAAPGSGLVSFRLF
jgi:hypothetical protein